MTGSRLGVLVLALLLACVGYPALGQECPRSDADGSTQASRARTLEGRLAYHDGIRGWFELQLDRPQCGERSIQLVDGSDKHEKLATLRGCRVRSSGVIDFSPTGYYSRKFFQGVETLEPVGTCAPQPPFPDYSAARPDSGIQAYRVDMDLVYPSEDRPIEFRVSSEGRELRPWQAYASYLLTGSFVLYGHCGEGFVTDKVFGTPEAHPTHFDEPRTADDRATFDPESAAQAGKSKLHLGYTCIRQPG